MRKQYYTVNDITKIIGIARRILHYYNETGLVSSRTKKTRLTLNYIFDIICSKIVSISALST